jgi:polysaccharide biosynthesis protein PslG
MLMRRALLATVLTSTLALGLAAAVPATAAPSVPKPIQTTQFGMHVPGISQGVAPSTAYGAVRLWDAGVAWGQVEQKDNKYWWNGMDAAIANANAQGARILYVLGSTPKWAASNTKQGTYPNKGAASMPKKMSYWKDWVTAVVKRYGASIESYQIWNEANLSTFWQGTPQQMADLTNEAAKIIRKYDPTAKIVSASTTVRLTSAYNKFFPKYLKGLKGYKWPVDAIAAHTYPPGTGTPGDRATYISTVEKDMSKAGVPASKELWDTEVNYGIKGPGSTPGKKITGADAAAWVAQTYLDDVRLGVARAYWYYWDSNTSLVGIELWQGTTGTAGYQTSYTWMNGKYYSCTSGQVNTCQFSDAVNPQVVAWASKGSGTFTVPANASVSCNALNQCTPVTPGSQVTIGSMPQWFGNPAS